MLSFIKYIIATVLGLVVFVVLFLVVIASVVSSGGKKSETVSENSILMLSLNKPIKEQSIDNPFSDLGLPMSSIASADGLIDILNCIDKAKNDENIKGISLDASNLQCGLATLQEVRDKLAEFKKSGKFVYTYAENYSESGYYLASVADKVYLNPVGLLEFNGISAQTMFFKNALEKLEVKVEVFKVGQFKSFVEPFILDKMSDANRQQVTSYLGSLSDFGYSKIAESRKLNLKEIKLISDSMKIHNAKDALKYKFVDELSYEDQYESQLKSLLKISQKNKLSTVNWRNYLDFNIDSKNNSLDKIAVIIAEGDVNLGKSNEENMGSDDVCKQIQKAILDKDIKAIVLRVNSPGGSAQASDIMWHQAEIAKKTKPVIASFSDVAASGGYYMSMGCDKIVAQSNTITGSIGVFGLLINARHLFENKLGITTDKVNTGKFSDIGSPFRDLTDHERKVIQSEVEETYTDFITKAGLGRKMSKENIDKIAQGRVWTGLQAKEIGLVDELGGLSVAIEIAAKNAKLSEYQVVYIPETKSFLEKLSQSFDQATISIKILMGNYQDIKTAYFQKTYQKISQMQGIQARLIQTNPTY